jgi:hypothetical protein
LITLHLACEMGEGRRPRWSGAAEIKEAMTSQTGSERRDETAGRVSPKRRQKRNRHSEGKGVRVKFSKRAVKATFNKILLDHLRLKVDLR